MSRLPRALLAAAALVLAAPPSPSLVRTQDEEPVAPHCRHCDSTGMLPCKGLKKCRLDPQDYLPGGLIHYSSFLEACEGCEGQAWVDCPDCANPLAEAALAEQHLRRGAAALSMAQLDEQMGVTLRKGESDHFRLVWEIDSWKVGKKHLADHQLLVLYLQRLEELYRLYREALGVEDEAFVEKFLVLVWQLPNDQKKASLIFCHSTSLVGQKLMGSQPRFSMCGGKRYFDNDEALHRYVLHNVTHLIFSHQKPALWIGERTGGAWLDEGLAHWMELHFYERADVYCYQEQNTSGHFKGGRYRPAVRKMVASGELPTTARIFTRVTNTLTPPEHAVSTSYVDYLLALDGRRFDDLGIRLRSKVHVREALQEAFDLAPRELERRWKEWVLETYPRR